MKITFYQEQVIETTDSSKSLLDIALDSGIQHIHTCGGNARCSTCRVLVVSGLEDLGERNHQETVLANRKGFEENIRLACQTKPKSDLVVRRLVRDKLDTESAILEMSRTTGKEMKLAILFSDIRGYTSFSEKSLPYDTVHILNRYFKLMGDVILKNNGFIDKYIGDGLMAVFGLEKCANPSYDAVNASLGMLDVMKNINQYMSENFHTTLEIGIGVHFGSVVLGSIGHPAKIQFTAIGDTVNMASRIESYNKVSGTKLLISESTFDNVKEYVKINSTWEAQLKGKEGTYKLFEVKSLESFSLPKEIRIRQFLFDTILITEVPTLVRMVFHDAVTYNPKTKTGGLNGSIFTEKFLNHPENKSFQGISERLIAIQKELKSNGEDISLADLLALASCVGIEKCGGPMILPKLGRIDAIMVDEEEINDPKEDWELKRIIERFSELGFDIPEYVALCGAHTLGKAKGKNFTNDPYSFTNSYYLSLLNPTPDLGLLPSDFALLSHSETKQYVSLFSKNEYQFMETFKRAYLKLLNLGFFSVSL